MRRNRTLSPFDRGLVIAVALAVLVLTVFTIGEALAEDAPSDIFGEVIDVRLVNLEVVVTDRQGNRVVGLAPDDFVLKVDGQERSIEFFSEIEGGLARQAATTGDILATPGVEVGKPVGTNYLVFIDDFFPIKRDRDFVLEAIARDLGNLRPEDRMAVVAFDGRRLDMLTSWTGSTTQLERAFRQARGRPADGLQRRVELARLRSSQGLGGFDSVLPNVGLRLGAEERQYAELSSGQVVRLVSAAAASLRSFAAPQGRKVMMILSGGWPFDSTQIASANGNRPVLENYLPRGDEIFKPLADMANLFGYTLYPVDVPGLQYSGPDVQSGGLPTSVASVASGEGQATRNARLNNNAATAPGFPNAGVTASLVAQSSVPALSVEHELQAGIGILARRTGGRTLLNSTRKRALEAVARDTRSYYWLGFNADRQRDDRKHKIEIEVRDPHLKVRARRDFLDLSRNQEANAMVEGSLLFGSGLSSGVLPVKLGSLRRLGRRFVEVPLTVAIPVEMITLLAQADGSVAALELRIAAMDERGNQSEIPVLQLRLEAEKDPSPDGFIRYDTAFKMRRGKHDVVVALFDPVSGRVASNRLEVVP